MSHSKHIFSFKLAGQIIVLTRQELSGLKIVTLGDKKVIVKLRHQDVTLTSGGTYSQSDLESFRDSICQAYTDACIEEEARAVHEEFRPGGTGATAAQSHFESLHAS